MNYAAALTGGPWRREPDEPELTWQEVLRDNADYPGAILRFLRSLGYPTSRTE